MSVRLPAPERRTQLLSVALEVFARQGFHATSMNDIADAAGITKPVLYQHFASKRQLYLELLGEVADRLLGSIAEAVSTAGNPREQVERGFAAYFQWVSDDHDSFTLLFGSGARRDEEFAEAVRNVESTIAAAIAGLIRPPDIDPLHQRTLAFALVGLAEGTSRHLVAAGEPFDPARVAAEVAELAWAGLRSVGRANAEV